MEIIEFVGMPRAGKTTQITHMQSYLENMGHKVAVVDDRTRASQMVVPIDNCLGYVISFAATALNETYKKKDANILIIDRGFNDVRAWAEFYQRIGRVTPDERDSLINAFGRFAGQVALTLNFLVSAETALQRHNQLGNSIEADELIMTERSLSILEDVYGNITGKLTNGVLIDGERPIDEVRSAVQQSMGHLALK